MRELRQIRGRQTGQRPSDADLLARFVARRDETAFELLLWRHERMVHGVCRRLLQGEQDAEDACQATFLTLACKAGSIGQHEALGGWLYRVAYRIVLRARADAAKRCRREKEAGQRRAAPAPDEPTREAARQDLRLVVDEEVSRLPANYRTPVVLCYLEGTTNEEAASELGCPTWTVVTRLARARRRLRARLASRGVGIATGAVAGLLSWSEAAAPSTPDQIPAPVRGALLFANDKAAAALVSPRVARLASGALHAMMVSRLKVVAAVLLAACVAGAGSALLARQAMAYQTQARPALAAAAPKATAVLRADMAEEKHKEPDGNDSHPKLEEVITRSFHAGKSPRLVLDSFNGGIDVVADGTGAVAARLTKQCQADTREQAEEGLKNIDVITTQEADAIRITARRLQQKDWLIQDGVTADLCVPAGAALDLHTCNGPVRRTGGTGRVGIETSNGAIQVKDSNGPLRMTTTNGPVVVTGATGARAQTCNSDVVFSGTLADATHSLTTSNGRIILTLPADARFRFDVATSRGRIASDFPAHATGRSGREHQRATVGNNPAATLRLLTSNGSIEIRKAK
jgi:RNA polymerase sigma factor (sigma-70 family)